MNDDTHCKKCRRELWLGGCAINIDSCDFPGNATCVLTMNQNSLVDAIKSIVPIIKNATREEALVLRTVLAVVEHVRPSSGSCPLKSCSQPLVVSRGVVAVHFAQAGDQRPCPASYRNVLGGFLMEAAK